MNLIVWIGKMGCGMGVCSVATLYWEDRQYTLDHKFELPEKCQECIRLNEEDREEKLTTEVTNDSQA